MDSTTHVTDNATKRSVALEVDPTAQDALNSFFHVDGAEVAGSFSTGAMGNVHDASDMAAFLKRPVLLWQTTWAVGTGHFGTHNPWRAFITHATIAPRLSYYSRLRGDMVLQFVVNGTPMHYGMLRVCYRPHPGLLDDSDPTFNFAVASNASASTQNYKMVASQFMGAYINPCYDNSIELRIPYASQKPGIELGAWKASTNYADFDRLGTLLTLSFAPLRHANNGNNPVIIEVYGHMENVVVDVPTAIPQGYTLEQAANIVRRTLRAAAKATALANEWTPRVLSAAAMLGFSRPLTHDPPESYRAIPYNLANYDSPDTATPLSLSASAEGTLGGQELGVGGTDELLLSNIAARTCFVCASNGRNSSTWVGSSLALW